jgi:predicted CXXCH cytochrome family protein
MDQPAGSCVQCHDDSTGNRTPSTNAYGLFAPNDNNLCLTCHALPGDIGIFPGNASWQQSGHALARTKSGNRCDDCHNPHGVKDAKGVVPALLEDREPALCVRCHDGSRAADIRDQLTKSYWHGMQARGSHDPREGSDPAKYSAIPAQNRHVQCSDCHNSHVQSAGVSRIEVSNGAAGMAPRYTYRSADDPSQANEYEICFKCHSGWTKQPAGQIDLALVTNPNNPSFHPIQAAGKNPRIDPNAFVNGYDATSILTCTSCHGTDDPVVKGPHGSTYQYLLKKQSGTTSKDDICFSCHAYDVYGNPTAPADLQHASRFNGGTGHAFHVGSQNLACASCHETHGSTRSPFLMARSRFPGISTYTPTPTGGTCASSCHAPQTYTVAYPR